MNENNLEFYTIADKMATQFFKRWKRDYVQFAQDYSDLQQEAYIAVLTTIRRFPKKPYKEVKKLTMRAIYWRLLKMYLRAKRHNKSFVKLEMLGLNMDANFLENEFCGTGTQEFKSQKNLMWRELREHCSEVDYTILDLRINKNLTLSEISKHLSKRFGDKVVTRERIRQRYEEIKKKVKKYLTKQHLLDIVSNDSS